jgi:hypothetical protein
VLRDRKVGPGDAELGLLQHRLVPRQDLVDGELALEWLRGIVRRTAQAMVHSETQSAILASITHVVVINICDDAFAAKMRVIAVSAAESLSNVLNHSEPEFGPRPMIPNLNPVGVILGDMNTWSLTV